MWGPKCKRKLQRGCLLGLPTPTLLLILQYISPVDLHRRVALVCKKMLALSRNKVLHQVTYIYGKADSLKVKRHLAKYWPLVHHLQLEMAPQWAQGLNVNLLKVADDFCPRLKQLTLLGFQTSTYPAGLFELAHGLTFSYLEKLNLQSAPWNIDFVRDIVNNRPLILKSIIMSEVGPTGTPLGLASKRFPHLRHCLALEGLQLSELINPKYLFQLGALASMKELTLTNLSHSFNQRDFRQLFSCRPWPRLQKVELRPCQEFDQSCWSALWTMAPQLRWVHLRGSAHLSLVGGSQDSDKTQGEQLATLVLQDMPRMGLDDIQVAFNRFAQLEYLEMSGFLIASTALVAPLFRQPPKAVAVFNNQAFFHPAMSAADLNHTLSKHKELLLQKELLPV